MSHRKRSTLEKKIQADIEAALGAEPDLLLIRNAVGKATYVNDEAREFHVPFGLGVGSPDLVAMLAMPTTPKVAVWFCLEVKADEGELDPEQVKCHAIWRRFGALIFVVRSIDEARAALSEARSLVRMAALASTCCSSRRSSSCSGRRSGRRTSRPGNDSPSTCLSPPSAR